MRRFKNNKSIKDIIKRLCKCSVRNFFLKIMDNWTKNLLRLLNFVQCELNFL